KVSRYSFLRERKDDPAFDEQVRLCSRYPEGVCDALIYARVLADGPDLIPAALALSRMRAGRRYQNAMIGLKRREVELRTAALRDLRDSTEQPDFDLMRLTLDEIKELEAINNAGKDGMALTDAQKIRWFDLIQKAGPRVNSEATPKMLSSVAMADE